MSIKSSQKLKKILEVTGSLVSGLNMMLNECMDCFVTFLFLLAQIILALGNYMNSSKRGAVYGFKLQSLDLVRCCFLPLKGFYVFLQIFARVFALSSAS